MEQITAYKLSDGTIVGNYKEALAKQNELDFADALATFIDSKDLLYDNGPVLYRFIIDNKDKIAKIFKDYRT